MELLTRPTPTTLRTEVVNILRDAIVTGQLKPNEHLRENAVAAQLSVSRSPVREAFRQLEQEGLIISIPNQGSYVKSFNEQDIREIFKLRAVLEDLACEIVLKENKLQAEEWAILEDYVARQHAAINAQNFDTLTNLDMQFHEFLCQKSGFVRLLKMWQGLRAQIQVLFYQRFSALETVPETVGSDHATIMEALKSGSLEKFSQVNHEINERVAEECIRVIHNTPPKA